MKYFIFIDYNSRAIRQKRFHRDYALLFLFNLIFVKNESCENNFY